jgi:integrase
VAPTSVHRPGLSSLPLPSNRLPFTGPAVARLVRAGKAGHWQDTRTPGLSLRIGATGRAVYVFTVRLPGHRSATRITLGDAATLSLDSARRAVSATRGRLAAGKPVLPPREARIAAERARKAALETARRDRLTLDHAFRVFLSSRDHKPRTIESYEASFQRIPEKMRSAPLHELEPDAIVGLHRAIGRSVGKTTANRLVALLSAVCRANGRRADNPAAGLKRFRETPRSRRLSPEESGRLRAVLSRARQSGDGGTAAAAVFVTVAFLTGARRSSIAAMRWQDLDLRSGQGVWLIPARWSKSGSEVAVALTDEAAAVLREWKTRNGPGRSAFVFPSHSATGHIGVPRKTWDRFRDEAGIGDVTLHDLRRSIGSQVAAAGGNAAVIAAALGHLSLQSAKSYLHLRTDEVRRVLESLGRDDA